MGGRFSMPRGPGSTNEVSKSTAPRLTRGKGIINGRTVMAPLAALTMACLLFVYTRTSIRAAKMNARKHREADGGQISWHKESLRRHGQIEKVDNDRVTIKEALMADISRKREQEAVAKEGGTKTVRSNEEDELRKMMGKKD